MRILRRLPSRYSILVVVKLRYKTMAPYLKSHRAFVVESESPNPWGKLYCGVCFVNDYQQ